MLLESNLFNVRRWLDKLDLVTVTLLLILSGFGLLTLYSASKLNEYLVYKQSIRFAIAFGVLILASQCKVRTMQRMAPYIYIISLVALLLVEFNGEIGKGAQRWLNIGGLRFEPSELIKIAVPLTLSAFLHNAPCPLDRKSIFLSSLIICPPLLLILKQPDLGTAIMILTSAIIVIFCAGIHRNWIVGSTVLLLTSLPLVWHHLHDYQRQRVLTFMQPENDPLGAGYHTIQARIALGSGGIHGQGYLHGSQTQLGFLPESHTDFIFAALGEEMGLLAAIILLLLIMLLTTRLLFISKHAKTRFGRLFSAAIALNFFCGCLTNIAMVCGLLPVVGIPLLMFSYGGTALVTFMFGVGLVLAINSHKPF